MYDSDQLSLGDSTADEMSLLLTQSQEAPTSTRDPSAGDPTFSSEEEMQKFLSDIGHKDVYLSPKCVEIDILEKGNLNCDCGECTGLKINDQQEYLCCNQLFDWKELLKVDGKTEECLCVTKSEAYVSSVNRFAVKGEC